MWGLRNLYIAERLDKSCALKENRFFFYKGRNQHGLPKKSVLACVFRAFIIVLQKRVSSEVTAMIGSDELMEMRSNCEELENIALCDQVRG